MRLKDHYRTLGVPVSATAEDIRKAYRRLAMSYHPDRNQDSPFAEGHFRELREAYSVLADAEKRRSYDEECWLLGRSRYRPGSDRLTPSWIAGEARKLRLHMQQIDTYRMNHEALQAYVLLLLSDEHLAVLREDKDRVRQLCGDIMASISALRYGLLKAVTERLGVLAGDDDEIKAELSALQDKRARQEQEQRAFPWIIVLVVFAGIMLALLTL